ncbi:PEP-CTERM-box response regulator transcription factor [Novosphingobium pituita]|uniref:PEP-CTERM-box response regulator transcription factor n=1 Tax=Novosphingobium pituita TaxID=3056842 RepID=A0ABQ6P428_9SPHN|nr:PEP-CTERM-box response regulator transcription factor [Novosphingobium sp. IK01]MDK4805680.1 PEP-CTERM-box response regulator transcription factor [Novosphingobium aromaticivorans]GMM59314.1 PEP-CTERM-box response regulator transcription factor [Novosphingobium sp. IK01]
MTEPHAKTASSPVPPKPGSRLLPKLLIVEDDPGLQAQLKWAYEDFEVLIAGDRASALTLLRAEEPPVVTLDLGLPPDPDGTSEGFALLDAIMSLKPDTKVIVASGHGARESALRAVAQGAYDFYAKPVDIDALGLIVRRAFHLHRIEAENRALAARAPADARVLGGMITAAPEMVKVARTIERVANTDVSVMLLGASGTGKELLARGLHEASVRSGAAFVAINCAAIPENLLESELFGHEKGAFTGAVKTTEGKIEQANGGTLFLDEVGDIPLQLQVKLLRFLQERTIERIGGRRAIPVDTRIVCATHQNLEAMIADGRFREDLWYRLAEIVIRIPSLAQRPGDAILLAKAFLTRFAAAMNPAVKGFAPDALAAIDAWGWPGNVRELENRLKRAVIMADGKLVCAADLDLPLADAADDSPLNLKAAREAADRKAIRHALARSEGNISNTARLLGISRPTLYDLLKQYDMQN